MNFHAQPYDVTATGFYFDDFDDFEEKFEARKPVEEYEIQFIDGDQNECALANAIGLNQCNLEAAITFIEDHSNDDRETASAIYRMTDRGESFDDLTDLGEEIVFETSSAYSEEKAIEEYAYEYIDSTGSLDTMPESLRYYFDYEAFARDMRLNGDVSTIEVGNIWYVIDCHI